MIRLPGARASGNGPLARLLGMGGLITLSTALVAGCVNVYVQPPPTASVRQGISAPTPGPTRQPTPGPTPQPVPTPVPSFTLTFAKWEVQGPDTFALGMEPYLVTFTVPETRANWAWCAIWFGLSAGPQLKIEHEAGKKVHSASAVMQFVLPANATSRNLALMSQPWVTIEAEGGACPPNWEIHGVRQE